MKKLVLILAVMLVMPSFATDITNSSDCDNATLGTYSAPVDMEAKWTANTINLQWYDDANDSTPVGTTCQYSSTIALPTEPSKPGYNFAGWALRQLFDLSTLNASTNGIFFTSKNLLSDYCFYYNDQTEDGIESYTCTESAFTSLNPGEWETTFDYGKVRGVSLCSTTQQPIAPTDESPSLDYCWCKATGFAEPNSSTYTNVASSSWVFGMNGFCVDYCASLCAERVSRNSNFRRTVYGITQ